MKNWDLRLFVIVLLISLIVGYFMEFKPEIYSDLITFLSIILGFEITSLSVLFNTPLKKSLYDRTNKIYKTELHRLRDFFNFSLWIGIISICIIFVIPDDFEKKIIYEKIIITKSLVVLPILSSTIFCFYKTFKDLLNIFVYPTND